MDRGILRTPVMKEDSGVPDEEKVSQVDDQLDRANGALERLTYIVNDLGERLAKVMREPYPPEDKEKARLEEVLVPLAGDIRSISEHIEVQTAKLRDYLDRLEL